MTTADSFLAFADEVLRSQWPRQAEEGARRSVVSRSYYAVFSVARACVEGKGESIGTGPSAHEEVAAALARLGDEDLARDVRSLRSDRNRADYEPSRVSDADARQAVLAARGLFARIRAL